MIGEELRFRLEAVRSWPSESSSPQPSGSAAGPATTRHAGRGSGLEESRAAARGPLREGPGTGKRTTPSRCSTSRRAESRKSGRSSGWRSGSRGSRSPSSGGSFTGHSREARRRSVCTLLSTPGERKVDLAGTIMTRPSCLFCGVSLCWRVAGWTTYCKSVSGLKRHNNAGKTDCKKENISHSPCLLFPVDLPRGPVFLFHNRAYYKQCRVFPQQSTL